MSLMNPPIMKPQEQIEECEKLVDSGAVYGYLDKFR